MDPSKPAVSSTLGEAKYIDFPSLPDDAKHADGSPALNRYSSTITRGHDFPGAQVLPSFVYIHMPMSMSMPVVNDNRQCCSPPGCPIERP